MIVIENILLDRHAQARIRVIIMRYHEELAPVLRLLKTLALVAITCARAHAHARTHEDSTRIAT